MITSLLSECATLNEGANACVGNASTHCTCVCSCNRITNTITSGACAQCIMLLQAACYEHYGSWVVTAACADGGDLQ